MDRNLVYVSAGLEPRLRSELELRDFTVGVVADIAEAADAVQHAETRALLWGTSAPTSKAGERYRLEKLIDEVAPPAITQGVLLGVIVDGAPQDGAWVTQRVDASAFNLGRVPPSVFRPLVIDGGTQPGRIAQACLRHPSERHWRDLPVFARTPDTNTALTTCAEDKVLLQRAFSDCDSIEACLLQTRGEGASARRVFEVWPTRGAAPVIPFIVKIGTPAEIYRERGATQLACGDQTPYAYFPPLAHDRLVSGRDRMALVTHFVDRAILLERYILDHSPAVAIASLFDGPLRCWRANMVSDPVQIGRYALGAGVCKPMAGIYDRAYRRAKARGGTPPTPKALIQNLRNTPERMVNVCDSHGDLHIKNVFVRENSVDVVLIDFNRAGPAPASRDPAELEVSLAFSKVDGAGTLNSAQLAELYAKPLLNRAPLPRRSLPQLLAIEQVRRQAAATSSEQEYQEMVAAHCLYYAGKGNADAYLAAASLL